MRFTTPTQNSTFIVSVYYRTRYSARSAENKAMNVRDSVPVLLSATSIRGMKIKYHNAV